MRENITTIKFTALLSAIFAVLTYVITLNMELAFFTPNWVWMSNNFAFTVFGGIFASSLVVMFCEIQKYLSNKSGYEQYIFYQTMYLYVELFLIQKNTEEFIEARTETVPENLLTLHMQKVKSQLNAIRGVDYKTFSSRNKLMIAQNDFCVKSIPKIESFFAADNYLRRTIIKVQIANLEQFSQQKPVTAADPLIFQILTAVNKKSLSFLDDVSEHLNSIDNACHDRFHWDEQKKKFNESYISIFAAENMEEFIKQGE